MTFLSPDPYGTGAAPRGRFLHHLNPLAKVAAILPAWIGLLFTRDVLTPLIAIVAAVLLLLVGARLRASVVVALLVGIPAVVIVMALSFGFWTDPSRVADSAPLFTVGGYTYTAGAFAVGLATSLRLTALVTLALVGGLTTTGPDLARALVAQLRVPYRIGYTAIAAYRFLPRFRSELAVIRQAQRVRGVGRLRGPLEAVVPLLASSIRHADRMALAMESRAFGAHPTRTERTPSRWRPRDTAFTLTLWLLTAALFLL